LDRVLRQVAERLLLLLLRQVAGQHGGRRPRVAAADDVVVRGRRGVVRGREPEVPAPELGGTVPGRGRAVALVMVRVGRVPVTPAAVLLKLKVGGQR